MSSTNPQFTALDPAVEIKGRFILLILSALQALEVNTVPFQQQYQLAHVAPSGWYAQQVFLDLLGAVCRYANLNPVTIGCTVANFIEWGEAASIDDGFTQLASIYQAGHRHGEPGGYGKVQLGEGHLRINAHTPFPSDMDYGLCWGVARQFTKPHQNVKVLRAASPCRLKGDDCCIYDVIWTS
jgi:hypothetical protein